MLKVVSTNEHVELVMSPEVLDISLKIGEHIEKNFGESDFQTIQNTNHQSLKEFVKTLRNTQAIIQSDATDISLSFSKAQYQVFQSLFHHADSFLDEVPALEDKIDAIEVIADLLTSSVSK